MQNGRYAKHKTTGEVIHYQSGGDNNRKTGMSDSEWQELKDARLDTVRQHALKTHNIADIDVGWATLAEINQWEIDYEDTQTVGGRPMINWRVTMKESDTALLPRYAEDILDGMPNKLSVAKTTLDRLQAKKILRETKPKP
jgi:hypothetical protein